MSCRSLHAFPFALSLSLESCCFGGLHLLVRSASSIGTLGRKKESKKEAKGWHFATEDKPQSVLPTTLQLSQPRQTLRRAMTRRPLQPQANRRLWAGALIHSRTKAFGRFHFFRLSDSWQLGQLEKNSRKWCTLA